MFVLERGITMEIENEMEGGVAKVATVATLMHES